MSCVENYCHFIFLFSGFVCILASRRRQLEVTTGDGEDACREVLVCKGVVKGGGQKGPCPPPVIWNSESKCDIYKHTIKVCVIFLGGVLGTSASAEHQMVSLIHCDSGSNAWDKSRALEGSNTETRELLVGTKEASISSMGHWFALQANY